MRAVVVAAALWLAACGRDQPAERSAAAGRALEDAARDAGLVSDGRPGGGVFAAGDDRMCLTGQAGRFRIGVSVDYGPGQRCIARGSARGAGRLSVDLGRDCRFIARHDGDRLAFPATLPAGCASLCEGRATLDALSADRLSDASGEVVRMRGADGRLLCAD